MWSGVGVEVQLSDQSKLITKNPVARWVLADKIQGTETENSYGGTEELNSQTSYLGGFLNMVYKKKSNIFKTYFWLPPVENSLLSSNHKFGHILNSPWLLYFNNLIKNVAHGLTSLKKKSF